ncbi:IS66 family transposase [Gynuella sunshinyii]|uniref:IS66 family transposase n=1 Tax=Gynuella sunshinyii TaxID=1445505 RepID=UPI000AA8280B|nr:IS66 family transposase [Gynuella sunshinyii]
MFKRIGIELDRTNLTNWMVKCGALVQPLINLLKDHLLQQPYLHMDETTLQVLEEPGKTPQSRSYMWVMISTGEQPACLFHYADTRGQAVPMALLSAQTQALMVDGYEWYQKACDEYGITRLGCWAHARRKFKDAQALQKKGKTGTADQALAYIQRLYVLEQQIKDKPPDQRYQIRHIQARTILDALKRWLDKRLLTVAPKTKLGMACHYLHHQWGRLTGYLEDGSYPIDNNAAERAIHPFAIGRKNWMFSKSQAGAKASANLYSLIETAKANDLNVYEYLQHVFKELPNAQSVEHIEALLPWNVQLG